MQLPGSVAVVTGAGSGIGRALSMALAADDVSVVIGDLDGDAAAATAGLITDAGGSAVTVTTDVSSTDGVTRLVDAARVFGPVDVYVANAGIIGAPGLGDDEADWDRIIDVNLRGHVRAAKVLVPEWVQRGRGYFVAVASAAGLLTQIGAAGYSVTKHAAVGFAEWLAITYGDSGIGVSCVCPMGVATPLLDRIAGESDPAVRTAAAAVMNAGEVMEPDRVAELTVEAIRADRFLVLPHAAVLDMYRQKSSDYERWIAGMRRYQRSLG
jgi:NAD(P)-dependent dehydrogenase (short-subunit alcohol dehydrogenase family)